MTTMRARIEYADGSVKDVRLGERAAEDFARPRLPRKWPAVMLDIETLGTTDDAVILEIGVVCFDLSRREIGPCDSWQLDPNLQEERRIDGETVRWWLAPERAEAFGELMGGQHELWHGVSELSAFLGRHLAEGGDVWTKGDFDLRILGHAFDACKTPLPWKYWQARELRTVLKWTGIKAPKAAGHRAEDDAKEQVHLLVRAEDWAMRNDREGGLDYEGGWMVYRTQLAETRANLLPAWNALHDDVKEAWCAGVRTAFEAPGARSEVYRNLFFQRNSLEIQLEEDRPGMERAQQLVDIKRWPAGTRLIEAVVTELSEAKALLDEVLPVIDDAEADALARAVGYRELGQAQLETKWLDVAARFKAQGSAVAAAIKNHKHAGGTPA